MNIRLKDVKPERVKNPEFIEHVKETLSPLLEELKKYESDVDILFNVDGGYLLNAVAIFISNNRIFKVIERSKEYAIYTEINHSDYPLLSNNDINHYKFHEFPSPLKARKLNFKSIMDHVSYDLAVIGKLQQMNDTSQKCRDEFLDLVKDEEIQWNHDKKSGTIKRNGIVMRFEFGLNHVYTSIVIDVKQYNYEIFCRLAENNYQDLY
ncbi:MAG: hypothetical protein LUF90_08965 [Rikenellaceae bacterium]|nr:hypothetical protein [Rikenellaceae bacterium]